MREVHYDTILQAVQRTTFTITCDNCGHVIPDGEVNELVVLLHPDIRHLRDLCHGCLEPVWAGICAALGVRRDDLGVLLAGQHD